MAKHSAWEVMSCGGLWQGLRANSWGLRRLHPPGNQIIPSYGSTHIAEPYYCKGKTWNKPQQPQGFAFQYTFPVDAPKIVFSSNKTRTKKGDGNTAIFSRLPLTGLLRITKGGQSWGQAMLRSLLRDKNLYSPTTLQSSFHPSWKTIPYLPALAFLQVCIPTKT